MPDRIAGLVTRLRDAERDIARMQSARLADIAAELAAGAFEVNGVLFVAHQAPDGTPADAIRKLALDVRGKIPAGRPAVVMITGVPADRPVVVIAVNEAGREAGLAAGALVGGAAKALGGGGGGKPDIAQGGGAPNAGPAAISAALEAVRTALRDSGITIR